MTTRTAPAKFADAIADARTPGSAIHAALSSMVGCLSQDGTVVGMAARNVQAAIGRGRRSYCAWDVIDRTLDTDRAGRYVWR
jgi:hypothetical protein